MWTLLSVKKIWDYAVNNALADLIYFNGRFLCCIRESDDHCGGKDGEVRILSSVDAERWEPIALLSVKGVDLRDPMLSIMPDGKLLLTMGGSIYKGEKCLGCWPRAAFSSDGINWSPVEKIDDRPNEWIWRVTWHNGVGYGVSYRNNPKDVDEPWITTLVSTVDGVKYSTLVQFDVDKNPSEATLRFDAAGTMIALLRRQGPGWIGISKAPYTKWEWKDIGFRLGGPNFLIFPNGDMWAGSRLLAEEKMRRTTLAKMSYQTYEPMIMLPSGGDNSYPGMVYREGILYMCYYSSHEEKTNVYLAKMKLQGNM